MNRKKKEEFRNQNYTEKKIIIISKAHEIRKMFI